MQSEKTKKFINGVNALINSGFVKNYTEIINALEWEKTMFSNVLNGRKNVPNDKYLKFTEVYQTENTNVENFTLQTLIKLDAVTSTLLSAVGELLAIQRGQPAGRIIENLQDDVNLKIKQIMDKSE